MDGRDFPDMLNPVVVREVRQSVRSRAVIVLLMASLLFLVLASGGFGIMQGAWSYAMGEVMALGRDMFMFLQGTLALVMFTGVPLYAAARLAYERQGAQSDLLFITTLKPGAVIRGKLFAAVVVLMLLFTSSLPFLSFTFLLRGIDIPTMMVSLALMFLVVVLLTQAAILLACLPMPRAFQILVAVLVVLPGLLFSWSSFSFAASMGLVQEGIGSQIGTRAFWAGAGTILAVAAALSLGMHAISVALVSPSASNRAFALRIRLTLAWLILLAVPLVWAIHEGDGDILVYPGTFMLGCFALVFPVVCGSPGALSERVRHQLPRARLRRALRFPWTNGFASGLVWSICLGAGTYALLVLVPPLVESTGYIRGTYQEAYAVGAGLLALGLAYGLTARLIRRTLFRRSVPSSLVWALALVLFAILSLLHTAILLATMASQAGTMTRGRISHPLVYFGNPIALADSDNREIYLLFALVWASAMLAVHLPQIIREIAAFRPARPPPPPEPADPS